MKNIIKDINASFADVRIIFIILILFSTYAFFNVLYSTEEQSEYTQIKYNETYNTPQSNDFFKIIDTAISFQFDNPELFFMNIILFGSIGVIITFIGLRFLRGQG